MKKKIISFCTAVVMSTACIPQVSAATLKDIITALPKYETQYKNFELDVDTDIEVKGSNGSYADGPYTIEVPATDPTAGVNYRATMYMNSVREEFKTYFETAAVLCAGNAALTNELNDMPVSGEFTIKVKYPSTMQIPNAMVTTVGTMYGFNDGAKNIFVDSSRVIDTDNNELVITIKVKDPTDTTKEYVKGKVLYDNLAAYLPDITLTCEGVPVVGVGTHRIIGEVSGWTKIGDEVILADMSGTPIADPSADPQSISKITYKSVQITTSEHPNDQNRNPLDGIYEDVILATPAPTYAPVTGGGGGTGLIAGGEGPKVDETPAPISTIVPEVSAETKADLDRENHYAYIIGYPEGDVRPEGNITRAEVATIFFRMLTDASRAEMWKTENNYTDVEASDWYNNAISTMTNAQVLNGYDDNTFKPNESITRAEFAAIIARFINGKYVGVDKFNDIAEHWAAGYINKAAHYGWINGYDDNTFRPDNNITRAEAMTLINNALDRHVAEDGMLDDMVTWQDNTADKWYYTAVQESTNSHYYDKSETEKWTSIRENRDWSTLENELSTPVEENGGDEAAEDEKVDEVVGEDTSADEKVDETAGDEATSDENADEANDTSSDENVSSDNVTDEIIAENPNEEIESEK